MDKWIEILKAGNYPQGNVSLEDLQLMAKHYNPELQQAPFISQHRKFNDQGELINNEPALAWVKAVKLSGNSLYVLPEDPASLKDIYNGKTFKYASAEIEQMNIDGKNVPYLGAIATTNFPASKIQQIKFNDKVAVRVYTNKLNFINEEELPMNKEQFIALCKALELPEDSKPEAVIAKFERMKDESKDNKTLSAVVGQLAEVVKLIKVEPEKPAEKKEENKTEIQQLTETVNTLLKRFDKVDADSTVQVFEQAVKDKKVLPAQKENLVGDEKKPGTFYKNAEGLRQFVSTLPVLNLSSTIVIPKDDKTQQPLTYAKLLKSPKLFNETKENNPQLFEQLRAEWQLDPGAQKEEEKK